MDREGRSTERMRKCSRVNICPFPHSLSISSPFPHSLSISSSFLILSPFPRSQAARLPQFVQPCKCVRMDGILAFKIHWENVVRDIFRKDSSAGWYIIIAHHRALGCKICKNNFASSKYFYIRPYEHDARVQEMAYILGKWTLFSCLHKPLFCLFFWNMQLLLMVVNTFWPSAPVPYNILIHWGAPTPIQVLRVSNGRVGLIL